MPVADRRGLQRGWVRHWTIWTGSVCVVPWSCQHLHLPFPYKCVRREGWNNWTDMCAGMTKSSECLCCKCLQVTTFFRVFSRQVVVHRSSHSLFLYISLPLSCNSVWVRNCKLCKGMCWMWCGKWPFSLLWISSLEGEIPLGDCGEKWGCLWQIQRKTKKRWMCASIGCKHGGWNWWCGHWRMLHICACHLWVEKNGVAFELFQPEGQ